MSSVLDLTSAKSLSSAKQTALLDVVDSLRGNGLSDFAALPQLIVCGDQSSGKSSLLEAISGVPFPRKDNLCTRFATEVILRRAPSQGLAISLVPGNDRSIADRDRLSSFRHSLRSRDDFPMLFEQAKEAMGLTGLGNAFSRDILRVEILGPQQPQLTIVDLPGMIHSENRSQTTQDVELVTELVKGYMSQSRSIILAVVSAKNDFANQVVLKRAREVDPEGLRTLGIITKPDTLPKGSDSEAAFISLARNEQVEFRLGWHVVKNQDLGNRDSPLGAQDEEEIEFFWHSNFMSLPPRTVGIDRLRERLSEVLFNQIRSELPSLIAEIERGTASCRSELDKLGRARITVKDQRSFLLELSQAFQSLCRDAIQGHYDDPFFGDGLITTEPEKRLRGVVRNKQLEFAEIIRTRGARWTVDDRDKSDKRYRTRAYAVAQILSLLKQSRGRELPGLPNPLLVGEVFREYSSPWEGLAREHIVDVWHATRILLERVLDHLTDPAVGDALLRLWLDPLMDERLQDAQEKLDDLISTRVRDPVTTNHYFRDTVYELQLARHTPSLTSRLTGLFKAHGGELTTENIPSIVSMVYPPVGPDMDEVAAEDVFDNMMAFYKVRHDIMYW